MGFSASGTLAAPTPTECPSFEATVTAVRTTCGDGVVDLLEQCDDGNRSPGDGCDEFCGIEEPHGGEACRPQAFCERPTKPQSTVLELRNAADPTKNIVSWKWPKGTAVGIFGDPVSTDDYRLCLFDASTATPRCSSTPRCRQEECAPQAAKANGDKSSSTRTRQERFGPPASR